ncbi:hypothetical protein [Actinoplanes sp. M2I2]|uniref:hypothetical protein n=1 Tax=Actinoplanes sp. M2I2 TaxID=1734444 RepID=UPI0020224E30|nr:hypothetical protein [Actinoplanes sp. M2I2]
MAAYTSVAAAGPARGHAPVPSSDNAARGRWGTVVGHLIAAVGSAATAAGVVLAVVDRPAHMGSFRTVVVTSGVSYEEYQQRLVPPHPFGHGLALAAATPSPAGPADAGQPASGEPFLKQEQPAGDSVRLVVPDTEPEATSEAKVTAARACAGQRLNRCGEVAESLARVRQAAADGRPQSSAQSRATVKRIIKGSRTRLTNSGKKQMVGAVVDVNLDIEGLRGKTVALSWSLWQGPGTETRIYGSWLNENLAYELTATSDHDTASVSFWIPLPKADGPYFLRSKLTRAGEAMATSDSQPFD